MKTTKRVTVTYLSVDKEGNLYYRDEKKEKIIIPGDQLVSDLELMDITFDENEYKGNITLRYMFSFVNDEGDTINLTLNRYAHLAHLFVNKLLNTDINRKMSIGAYPKIQDGETYRIITIEQDGKSIKGKLQREEYPAITADGDNTERSHFFEKEVEEIQKKLRDLPESEPVETDEPAVKATETLADKGSVLAKDIETGEADLPY